MGSTAAGSPWTPRPGRARPRVEAWDRDGLERLLRYCGRPLLAATGLAHERLAWAGADGEKVAYTLAHPDPDGRTVLILTPLEFLQRLAHLVPPPRRHLLRYWGVLAPNAPLRARVIALAAAASGNATAGVSTAEAEPGAEAGRRSRAPKPIAGTAADPEPQGEKGKGRRASPQASLWALLLARILALLPLTCPNCGQQMQIIAFVTDTARGRARPGCVQLDPPHPDPSRRTHRATAPVPGARASRAIAPTLGTSAPTRQPVAGADPTPDFDPNVDPEPQFDTGSVRRLVARPGPGATAAFRGCGRPALRRSHPGPPHCTHARSQVWDHDATSRFLRRVGSTPASP